jgi:hypothetical protein
MNGYPRVSGSFPADSPEPEEANGTVEEPSDARCELRTVEDPNLVHWSACMRELSLHILDVLENSLAVASTRVELIIDEDLAADRLHITIRDNGRGMSAEQLARVFDPFYTTRKTRHVGLGLPLFQAAAQRCAGDVTLESQVGQGTTLHAAFQHSHIDRAPLGDMTTTLLTFLLGGTCDLYYRHRVGGREFAFDTAEIRAELGEIPLSHPEVRRWLQQFIADGEAGLR